MNTDMDSEQFTQSQAETGDKTPNTRQHWLQDNDEMQQPAVYQIILCI